MIDLAILFLRLLKAATAARQGECFAAVYWSHPVLKPRNPLRVVRKMPFASTEHHCIIKNREYLERFQAFRILSTYGNIVLIREISN